MSTNPANDQLSAFLDGELEDAEAAALEAALEGDEALRGELDQLKAVQRLLRSHGPARAPEGFAARVIAAAAEEPSNVIAGPWWRRPITIQAAGRTLRVPVEGIVIAAAAALALIVALPRTTVSTPDPSPAVGVEAAGSLEGQGAGDDGVASVDTEQEAKTKGSAGSKEGALGMSGEGEGGGGASYGAKPVPKPVGEGEKGEKIEKTSPPPAPESAPLATGDKKSEVAVGIGGLDGIAGGTAGEGSADGDLTLTAAGMAIDLYSEDDDILRQLQVLASRFGGTLRDRAGKAIQVGVLQADVTEIYVDVPSDQASAFTKALGSLDAKVSSTGNSALTSGSTIKVPIRIVRMANGPSTKDVQPPNAARKSMDVKE